MPYVVLLRGVNVGGRRRVSTVALAARLADLGVRSFGAAGTFVVRNGRSRDEVRAAFAGALPFETEVVVREARELARLVARRPFGPGAAPTDVVRFVTVLATRPAADVTIPLERPTRGPWALRLLARDGAYVVGEYRRVPEAIRVLATLDRLLGVSATTRTWSTIERVIAALDVPPPSGAGAPRSGRAPRGASGPHPGRGRSDAPRTA